MKVFAYSLYGTQPRLAWSDVDTWMVHGAMLTIWRGKTPEVVVLPTDVIGLHDDGPHPPTKPNKYERKREEEAHGTGEAEWNTPQRRYGRQRAGRPGK